MILHLVCAGDCSVGSSSLAVATTVGLATSLAWRPAQVLDFFSPVCLAHLGHAHTYRPPSALGYPPSHHLKPVVAWGGPHSGWFYRRALPSLHRSGLLPGPHPLRMPYPGLISQGATLLDPDGPPTCSRA